MLESLQDIYNEDGIGQVEQEAEPHPCEEAAVPIATLGIDLTSCSEVGRARGHFFEVGLDTIKRHHERRVHQGHKCRGRYQ